MEKLGLPTTPIGMEPVTTVKEGLVISAPTLPDEVDISNDVNLKEMSLDVATNIMTKLGTLLENESLNVQDMKDITSMTKDMTAFISKLNPNESSTTGLASFVSRLKA